MSKAPNPVDKYVGSRVRMRRIMRHEVDEEIVEEIDEVGAKPLGVREKKIGDGARDIAALAQIAAPDDLVQSGNHRRGNGHAALLAGPASRTFLSRSQMLVRYRLADDDKTAGISGQDF